MPGNPDRRPVSVLVTRFSAVGDVAMAIPVLYTLAREYPSTRFILATRPMMASVFINCPPNLTIVGVHLDGRHKGLAGMRRLLADVRRDYGIDAMVDLHDVIRTRFLRTLCRIHGIPVAAISKDRKGRRRLTRRTNKVLMPLRSSRARYRDAFARLGFSAPYETFDGIYGPDGHADSADYATISAPKPAGEKWVAIAPFAAHDTKIYPPQMMEQVVEALSQRPATRIFLLGGGASEESILSEWERRYPATSSLAGKRYGFAAEMALMSVCDCMISMDSANMHLASLVRVPVISLWGATHPYCGFKPWRQPDHYMLQLPLECRPCSVYGARPCFRGDKPCMRGISPRTVLQMVTEILQSDTGAKKTAPPCNVSPADSSTL